VWNAGLKTNIENIEDDPNPSSGGNKGGSSSTKGSPTPTAPSVVTIGGETIVVTASSKPEASEKPSGPNKAGIAAGVVVGVVAIAAIAGGLWFWLRAKKRRELAEEHKRQAAINAFVKPDTTGDSFDARLEPAALRRMSDGSIADNQDYSRKILRVTNA
jgi:cell wall integrity and stress response component